MVFKQDYLYHIYNQGNNRQAIFFNRANYLYFLDKMKIYLTPFLDIIAWCLMPNHFHFMVWIKYTEINIDSDTHRVTSSHPVSNMRTLNNSIAIMLRSYTRAINKQENRSGALFRESTKAECLNCPAGLTPSFLETSFGTMIKIQYPEMQYPKICFDYIHNNPVMANMVLKPENWEFSSARDYLNLRKGKLINKEKAKEFLFTG